MNKLRTILFSLLVSVGFVAVPLLPTVATYAADDPVSQIQTGVSAASGDSSTSASADDFKTGIKNVVNVMLFVLGAIAVIMIIIGGIRYTTSNGDSSQITGAKNTILYAVVGLVVAILAYAIVNFVISSFKK